MKRLPMVAALAAAVAAGPAAAYVRTVGSGGVALAWRVPLVAWHLNRDWPNTAPSCKVTTAGDDPTLDAVQASFAAWEEQCADLRFVYGGTIADIRTGNGASENVVVFRRGWCSNRPEVTSDPCWTDPDVDCGDIFNCFEDHSTNDRAIVALTSVLYAPATGRIFDAGIALNGWDGAQVTLTTTLPDHGWYFTCFDNQPPAACTSYGQDGCKFIDLRNTVTHEVGHFLGLAHPCGDAGLPSCSDPPPAGEIPYSERTMNPTTTVGDVTKRDLSSDDIAGVCAIYPPMEGGCGCGSGGAPETLALLLAAFALRRSRRRGR